MTIINTYNIEQFSYSKDTRRLVAEASTLGLVFEERPSEFVIAGKNKKVRFVLYLIDLEEDVLIYHPNKYWKTNTKIGDITVHIVNT